MHGNTISKLAQIEIENRNQQLKKLAEILRKQMCSQSMTNPGSRKNEQTSIKPDLETKQVTNV